MSYCWGLVLLFFLGIQVFPGSPSAVKQNTTVHPGFPKNASTNDPKVKNATRFAVYAFNNQSNDIYLFKELKIQRAMVQLVKGIKYMIMAEIRRTVCPKKEFYNLDKCEFQQSKPLKQTFQCYFEVWIMDWLHTVRTPVLQCH